MKQRVIQNVFSKSLSPLESDLLEIGGDGTVWLALNP